MRGFLNEIKNVAVNRATNRINQTLWSYQSNGKGIPNNIGGTFQTNVYRNPNKNPFKGETVIYPEDLGSNDWDTMSSFTLTNKNANGTGGQGRAMTKKHWFFYCTSKAVCTQNAIQFNLYVYACNG